MTISRKMYLQKIIALQEQLIITSQEYEEISNEFIMQQSLDIPAMKELWMTKVKEFKQILAEMDALEVPNAFTEEGEELKEQYRTYIGCVEEKTQKFSVETMENGVLEAIQEREAEAAERIDELIEAMFGL